MLESLKDGELFASKYDNQRITANTPNILMVFSNDAPNTTPKTSKLKNPRQISRHPIPWLKILDSKVNMSIGK